MTQEDKKLLLKDLCGRLPYGVKAQYYGSGEEMLTVDTIEAIYTQPSVEIVIGQYGLGIEDIKPYLRPMSSMTEEEKDYVVKHSLGYTANIGGGKKDEKLYFHFKAESFDWLNKHHFDYRGLIDRGFAIEVTEDNNPYKE